MFVDNRIYNYKMEYYRYVYRNSPMWDGEASLEGKRVIVYCEQGLGDIIQFIRYLPQIKAKGCHTILHCHQPLHPLLPYISGVDEWWGEYDDTLPPHDYHFLTLDLPYLVLDHKPVDIQTWWEGRELDKYMPQISSGIPPAPYIHYKEKVDLPEGLNVGVCWAGNPRHFNNKDRSCHLNHFRCLRGRLISLQKDHYEENTHGAEDMSLWGLDLSDILNTMKLINSVDVVVTVDSMIMHLAGAVNKNTFCLLGNKPDMRWPGDSHNSPWYPSVCFCRKQNLDWGTAFEQLPDFLRVQ